MKNGIIAAAILALAALAACTRVALSGHETRKDSTSVAGAPVPAVQPPITRLLVDYTSAAQEQTNDDARFSTSQFSKVVGERLAARGLADLASDKVVRVAAIEVDEFDVRASSNTVLMGRVTSTGALGGKVRLRDGSGTQLREFHVRAQVTLSISRSNKGSSQLDPLYREFGRLIADELTGTVTPR
jgi:hypothetical protein